MEGREELGKIFQREKLDPGQWLGGEATRKGRAFSNSDGVGQDRRRATHRGTWLGRARRWHSVVTDFLRRQKCMSACLCPTLPCPGAGDKVVAALGAL